MLYFFPDKCNNFLFHFIFYVLADLCNIEKYSKFNTPIKYDWQKEAVELMAPDYIYTEDSTGTYFEGTPYIKELKGGVPERYYHFIRDTIFSNNPHLINLEEPRRFIFIDRKKNSYRHIINLPEEIHGFEKIYLEDYSMSEKIKLFQNAKVIVSPFGSGLTMAVFSHIKTKIIEITVHNAEELECLHYKSICSALSISYNTYTKVEISRPDNETYRDNYNYKLLEIEDFLDTLRREYINIHESPTTVLRSVSTS